MKRLILSISFWGLSLALFAQSVGINATGTLPDSSSVLDVQSSSKGMLMPRMNTDQRDAIVNPALGLMIYNLDDSCFNYYSGNEWILDCGVSNAEPKFSPLSIGGSGSERGTGIDIDHEGNRLIVGNFTGTITLGNTTLTSSGNDDIFVVKTTPQGQVLWAVKAGGTNLDNGNGISVDAAGNSYITGYFSGSASFGNTTLVATGSEDGFVAKIDASGSFVWALLLDGSTVTRGLDISADAAGNSFVTGSGFGALNVGLLIGGFTNLAYGFFLKVSPSGQPIWLQGGYGAVQSAGIRCNSVSVDASGNSYYTGFFGGGNIIVESDTLKPIGFGDVFVIKLDPGGNLLWRSSFGGPNDTNIGFGIDVDDSGNSYITGYFEDRIDFQSIALTSGGNTDVFITKLNPTGQVLWAKAAGGTGTEQAWDVAVDGSGNSYITGYFDSNLIFDANSLTTNGGQDIFVAKIDPNSNFLWAKNAGANASEAGEAIAFDKTGNAIVLTGNYSGTVDFGGEILTASGSQDAFIWSLSTGGGKNAVDNKSLASTQDNDGDPTNEFQSLSLNGDTLKLTNGGTVVLPGVSIPDTALPIPIIFHGSTIFVHPDDNATNVNWATAQSTCTNLTAFGFSDWYLPSRLELDAMYKQSYYITGLSQTALVKYWSSTQIDVNTAYSQRLDYGGPDPDPKTVNAGHNCRCIRKN